MTGLHDLIMPFMLAFLMTSSGYAVALISDYIKIIILIPTLLMFMFDSIIIYFYYAVGISKLQIMTGIMIGIIFKIIVFILYYKHLKSN